MQYGRDIIADDVQTDRSQIVGQCQKQMWRREAAEDMNADPIWSQHHSTIRVVHMQCCSNSDNCKHKSRKIALRSPEQYLWLHRRWKSRPKHEREGEEFPRKLREKLEQLPWMTEDELQRIVSYRHEA